MLDERLLLYELLANELGDYIFPPQNIRQFVDYLDEFLRLFQCVGNSVIVDLDVFRVRPCLVIVLADKLYDRLQNKILQKRLVWVLIHWVINSADLFLCDLNWRRQIRSLNLTQIFLYLQISNFHCYLFFKIDVELIFWVFLNFFIFLIFLRFLVFCNRIVLKVSFAVQCLNFAWEVIFRRNADVLCDLGCSFVSLLLF